MNEEARATLLKSIESKQKVLQRTGEDAQNDFQQQQNEIAQRILQKMAPVIDKYAKSNGYGLLFDSSNPWPQGPLLWATAGVDLTKVIVDAYNAQSGVAAPVRPAGSTRSWRKACGHGDSACDDQAGRAATAARSNQLVAFTTCQCPRESEGIFLHLSD